MEEKWKVNHHPSTQIIGKVAKTQAFQAIESL